MPGGRPPKEINWAEFDKLCSIQCTEEEMAAWFECCVETLHSAVKRVHKTSFSDYYEQKAASGKISLRRVQWQLAMKGDKTMLIWLGKQHLGQQERAILALEKIPDHVLAEEAQRRLQNGPAQQEITTVIHSEKINK